MFPTPRDLIVLEPVLLCAMSEARTQYNPLSCLPRLPSNRKQIACYLCMHFVHIRMSTETGAVIHSQIFGFAPALVLWHEHINEAFIHALVIRVCTCPGFASLTLATPLRQVAAFITPTHRSKPGVMAHKCGCTCCQGSMVQHSGATHPDLLKQVGETASTLNLQKKHTGFRAPICKL